MKNMILFWGMLFFFSGCIVDKLTITTVKWQNSTPHKIEILPFKNSIIDSANIKSLHPHESVVIEKNSNIGDLKLPIHLNIYFLDVDSVWIIWNNTHKVVHMLSGDYTTSEKYISFSDKANNIGYVSGYDYLFDEKSSHHYLTKFFTETDYEFAK